VSKLKKIVGIKKKVDKQKHDIQTNKIPSRSIASRKLDKKRKKLLKDISVDNNKKYIVDEIRNKIKPLLNEAIKDRPAYVIGLLLAIVNQETGNYSAANCLIDEYKLDELFDMKKF